MSFTNRLVIHIYKVILQITCKILIKFNIIRKNTIPLTTIYLSFHKSMQNSTLRIKNFWFRTFNFHNEKIPKI